MMASVFSATKPCVSALSKTSNGPVNPLTAAHFALCRFPVGDGRRLGESGLCRADQRMIQAAATVGD